MSLFALYRFYNTDDELLYVGKTIDPPRRLREHRSDKQWWLMVASIEIEHFPDAQSLDYAERQAILHEDPLYNIALVEHTPEISNAEKRATLEAFGFECLSNRGSGTFIRPDRPSRFYTRAAAWTEIHR